MDRYGQIFGGTWEGSLCGKPGNMQSLWCYVVAHKDWLTGIVELNPKTLAAQIGGSTVDEITAYIQQFCSPDKDSRECNPQWLASMKRDNPNVADAAKQGCRLLRLDTYSYYVVKHTWYLQLAGMHKRRIDNRLNAQSHRDRVKQDNMGNTGIPSANVSPSRSRYNTNVIGSNKVNREEENLTHLDIRADARTRETTSREPDARQSPPSPYCDKLLALSYDLKPKTAESRKAIGSAINWLLRQKLETQEAAYNFSVWAVSQAENPPAAFIARCKVLGYVPLSHVQRSSLRKNTEPSPMNTLVEDATRRLLP